jgi:hypothetical protein
MRSLLCFLLIFSVARLVAADDATPPGPPQLPQDLTLTSKVVLHKISVVRWEKDRVIIHYPGGTDPIYYKYIAEPQRSVMLALRDIEMAKGPAHSHGPDDATAAVAPAGGKFLGMCYLNQPGATTVFKMPGVLVLILPPDAESRFKDNNATIILPKPLLQVTTDGQGQFAFELPDKQEFYLVAQSYRLVGGQHVYYHWRMPSSAIKDPSHIILNSDNSTNEGKKLVFDHDIPGAP